MENSVKDFSGVHLYSIQNSFEVALFGLSTDADLSLKVNL